MIKESVKRQVAYWTYQVSYVSDLCNWIVGCLASIPSYEPPEAKSVEADFSSTESERSSGTND